IGDIRIAWRGKTIDDKQPDPNQALTWKSALTVVAAVVIWYAATDAQAAFKASFDFAHLGDVRAIIHGPSTGGYLGLYQFVTAIYHGLGLGIMDGIIMGVKGLVFVWVGPTFFDALSPVLNSIAKYPVNFVASRRNAWSKGAHDEPQKPDAPDGE